MKRPNYTRGPWKYGNAHDGLVVFAPKDVGTPETIIAVQAQSRDNARLISLAPELLLACEGALTYIMLPGQLDKTQLVEYLHSVIKRATEDV